MKKCKDCRFCKVVYRDNIMPFVCKKYFCEKNEMLIDDINQNCSFFQMMAKDYQTNLIKNSAYDISDERFKDIIKDLNYLIEFYKKEEQGVVYNSINEYLIIHLNETLRKEYLSRYNKETTLTIE